MPKLTEIVKRFIVEDLATYSTPTDVAEHVKEEFGLTVTRHQVQVYDPTKAAGKDLSAKLRKLFEAKRKAFDKSTDDRPAAKKAYRLKIIQRVVERAMDRNNLPLVLDALERAAKEVGGAYTNRHELTGARGKPLIPEPQPTIEQVEARIRALLKAPGHAASAGD